MKFAVVVLMLLLSAWSYAQEKVPASWDCYLPGDSVSCEELKIAFFDSQPVTVVNRVEDAKLSIVLRSMSFDPNEEYQYSLKGNLVETSFKYPLNNTLSADEKFEKVFSMLKSLATPFFLLHQTTTTRTTSTEKPYYFNPTANLGGSKKPGSTNFNGSASLTSNYSTKNWRLVSYMSTGTNINEYETTAYNSGLKTNVFWVYGGVGVIRSLSSKVSVALFANDSVVSNKIETDSTSNSLPENALKNTAESQTIKAGAEWILVPFITETTSGNLAIRYTIGTEKHQYVDPKSFDTINEQFIRHSLVIFAARHFKKVDVDFMATGYTSTLRVTPLIGATGTGSVSYRISPRATIGLTASIEYAKNRIMSTAASGNTSFSSLTGATPSALNYSAALTFKLNLGNIRLYNKEQRWKE